MPSERAAKIERHIQIVTGTRFSNVTLDMIERALLEEREEARKQVAVEICKAQCEGCSIGYGVDKEGWHIGNTGGIYRLCAISSVREHFKLDNADFQPREETEGEG